MKKLKLVYCLVIAVFALTSVPLASAEDIFIEYDTPIIGTEHLNVTEGDRFKFTLPPLPENITKDGWDIFYIWYHNTMMSF
jgi:hypothetical protein